MTKLFKLLLVVFLLLIVVTAEARSRIRGDSDIPASRSINKQAVPYTPAQTRGGLLFVEDPGDPGFGPATKPDQLWNNVLTQILGAGNYGWYGPTTDPTSNGPDLPTMQNYDIVIWNTYDFWFSDMALTQTDQTNIQDYINGGGKFWLIGQDIIYSGVPTNWLSTNFHLASAIEDYCEDAVSLNLQGIAEISGISFTANCDYQYNGFWCDALNPDGQAHHIVNDLTYGQYNAIAFPNTTPLQTSFWAVDGRGPSSWSEWYNMVATMLDAFGVYGIEEKTEKMFTKQITLQISPSIVREKAYVKYNLPTAGHLKLNVYDNTGKLINTLLDCYTTSGNHQTTWNVRDANGAEVPSGVYFVRLSCGEYDGNARLIVAR